MSGQKHRKILTGWRLSEIPAYCPIWLIFGIGIMASDYVTVCGVSES